MPTRKQERERQFQLAGWALFLVCSFFFIADSVVAGSPLGLVGSVVFSWAVSFFSSPSLGKRDRLKAVERHLSGWHLGQK